MSNRRCFFALLGSPTNKCVIEKNELSLFLFTDSYLKFSIPSKPPGIMRLTAASNSSRNYFTVWLHTRCNEWLELCNHLHQGTLENLGQVHSIVSERKGSGSVNKYISFWNTPWNTKLEQLSQKHATWRFSSILFRITLCILPMQNPTFPSTVDEISPFSRAERRSAKKEK